MNTYQYCRIGALVALAGALSARAEVTYVGDDVETDSAWRNPSVVKANDIDADNVYGTLGYYLPSGRRAGYRDPFYNTFTSEANTDQLNGMPSWFTSLSFTNPVQTGRSWGGDGGNFGNLDKVHPAHTGFTGAPILNAGAEFNSPDMALRMTRSNSPAFRLTLIFGNSTEASSWIPGQAVTVDDGAGAAVAVSPDPVFVGTGVTAYQSWDISAGNSDIIIVINGNGGLPRLAGLAVDIAGGVPPSVTSDPAGGTYLVGANVNLSGATAGTAPSYQWFKVGGPALSAGTNRVLNFPSISLDDAGSYYFVANNPAGSATSAVAVITVESALPASLTAYRSAVTGESSLISHYGFELQNARDSKGSNHGTLRGGATFGSSLFGGADKSLEPNAGQVDLGMVPEFQFADGTGTLELWFRTGWDPPTPGSASPCLFACQDNDIGINYAIYVNSPKTQIQLINGFETLTYAVPFIENIWHHLGIVFDNGNVSLVLDGQPLTNQASGLVVNPFALGGAAASSQIASHVPLDGGNNRWIGNLDEVAVYRNALPLTAISAHYALSGQLPEISAQPQNAARFAGEPLTLAVGAIGPLLNYQWYKGGAVIAAATNSMLSFASAALEDAGQYSVVVSNSNGAITSTVATVSVRTPNFPAFEAAVRGEANLISLYTFDTDDPGTLSVSDAKGGKTGTVSGLASYEPGLGGGTNRAFVFDGGSFITLGSVPEFAFTGGTGTIELLVRNDRAVNAAGYNPAIVAYREGGTTGYSLHHANGLNSVMVWNGLGLLNGNTAPADPGTWHHVAVVFGSSGGTNSAIYFDGVKVAEANYAPSTADPTSIGALFGSSSASAPAEAWLGALDNIAYYSTALSDAAIQAHYGELAGVVTETPQLSVTLSGSDVVISWTGATTGWILEKSDTVSGGSWATVGSTSPVTSSATGTQGFFRLRKP